MKEIIVTISDEEQHFTFDIEIPVSITVDKFKSDLYDALLEYDPNIPIHYSTEFDIVCNRLGNAPLKHDLTIQETGIWNGDKLVIVNK